MKETGLEENFFTIYTFVELQAEREREIRSNVFGGMALVSEPAALPRVVESLNQAEHTFLPHHGKAKDMEPGSNYPLLGLDRSRHR